jgi:pyruvate,orthophosphate dikinase
MAEDLRNLTQSHQQIVRERAGCNFPRDPREQLNMAIRAVLVTFDSNTHRAADLALN